MHADRINEKRNGYILFYTAQDINNKDAYAKLIDSGMHSVNNFLVHLITKNLTYSFTQTATR